ncbi:MAG: BglII/BstYI family type II restriction endonuclease [Thermoguttaceae bacterium]
MRIVANYSFNDGENVLRSKKYVHLLDEVEWAIQSVRSEKCRTKKSTEKTMQGRLLYSPVGLNSSFKKLFAAKGWSNHKEKCEYSDAYYVEGYQPCPTRGAFRDIDFVKERLGVEVQFGKYAFMVYNVCAKMTIFHNLGIIDAGIEIVPVKRFAENMSTGVSYFEQFAWDLSKRGVSNIDIPVLVLGIDVDGVGL